MGHRFLANSATASGVRWILLSLAVAATGSLVSDVPFYFGAAIPALDALTGTTSYRLYRSILSLVVPLIVGLTGFVGILRIERDRGWTWEWRGERARPALFIAAGAAALLFGSGLDFALVGHSIEGVWNPVRMTLRFVVVLAGGVYLLETAARVDPESRMGLAKNALVVGTFAAAVRMSIAAYNGWFAPNSPADFMRSRVEPLLSPAAFLLAVLSLFGWVAVYYRALGRLTRMRAGGTLQPPLPFSPRSPGSPVGSESPFERATSRPPAPRSLPGSTPVGANRRPPDGPDQSPGTPESKDRERSPSR